MTESIDLAERIIGTIDLERFGAIIDRYDDDEGDGRLTKYLDLQKWMRRNLQRVQSLGLDVGVRRRVLDLGCGCGYFLYICKLLGHDVVGIDLPVPMYTEITELLGVPVVRARIRPFKPLPDLGAPFDVMTAYMVTFNGHETDGLWGPAEWQFLLDNIGADTTYLELNREPDGNAMTRELERFFASRGARISGHRVFIE